MPRKSLFGEPMSATQRSRRKRREREYREEGMRTALLDSAAMLLRLSGEVVAVDASKARTMRQQAERNINAANDEPDAPLTITTDDPLALQERNRLERRDILRSLERMRAEAGE